MLILNKEHANKIDDEIIAEIRRSAFLVADFTGQRQNVYFETGLRSVWDGHPFGHVERTRSKSCILISGSTTASTGKIRRTWRSDFKLGSRLCLAEGRSPSPKHQRTTMTRRPGAHWRP